MTGEHAPGQHAAGEQAPGEQAPGEHRVARLLRWYPPSWRARYGAEFAELLLADMAERPADRRRAANVALAGLRARLAGAGLTAHPVDPDAAARGRIATLACCAAVAATFGTALWSQLATGLQWAPPATPGVARALALMSAALLALAALALLAVVPLAGAVVRAVRRGRGREIAVPAAAVLAATVVLVAGGRHFQNGWPGTGGDLLARHGIVPGLAAFGWACTLWVTSYWAHPALLAAFPGSELAWMAGCPAAISVGVTGAVRLVLRAGLSPRGLRYTSLLARIAGACTVVLVAGALAWLGSAPGSPASVFHAGALDRADLAVVALAAVTGALALRHGGPGPRARAGVRPDW